MEPYWVVNMYELISLLGLKGKKSKMQLVGSYLSIQWGHSTYNLKS